MVLGHMPLPMTLYMYIGYSKYNGSPIVFFARTQFAAADCGKTVDLLICVHTMILVVHECVHV